MPHGGAYRQGNGVGPRDDAARLRDVDAACYARRRKEARRRRRWRVVFWVAVVVFVAAVAALVAIVASYHRGNEVYGGLAESAFEAPVADAASTEMGLADLRVDWDALLAVNPDTIGWIYVPGTTINYPVVYSGDDSRYLSEDFYGETSPLVSYGAIFLSGENDPDLSDDCNVVYGHHLLNGAMFSPIAQLTDSAAFNEHRTVYFLSPEGSCRLTSFALVHVDPTDPIVQPNFASPEEEAAYVRDKMDRSVVVPDGRTIEPEGARNIFMLSTCDNLATDGRYVLCCYVAESTNPNVVAAVGAGSSAAEAPSVDPADAGAIGDAAGSAANAAAGS